MGEGVAMATMSLRDSMFLMAESRERPTHVGSLQLFERPERAGPDVLGDLHRRLVTSDVPPARLFRRRAVRSVATLGQWAWEEDHDLDIEYHVRLSALPRPCRIRELLELVSRLHGTLLDRHRPLWEVHLIEGVEGDRFAVYTKIHHALMDGVTSMKQLQRALTTDPDARGMPPTWTVDPRPPQSERSATEVTTTGGSALPAPITALGSLATGGWHAAESAVRTTTSAVGVVGALASSLYRGFAERDVTLPFEAPSTMFNVPITGARRFAAQSWPLKRIQRVRERTHTTVNDVVLAMSAGALRRYLLEHDALPERPLVAAVPVSLAAGGGTGNQLGAILVGLATEEADPARRLERIRLSGVAAKQNISDRDPLATAALSVAVAAPLALGSVPGLSSVLRPGFNIIISNVPGPKETLYWEGAKLAGLYPLSVAFDGQAFNITVTSYGDHMEFGLTGCRRRVPHLQWMLTFLEESLVELETVADSVDVAR